MAGERLVLAELIVDSTGVVKGVRDATESFRFLPQQVEKQTKAAAEAGDKYLGALEHRFLGFRHVAGALLGGFTIAGIIDQFKNLVVEIAKADPAFAALQSSVAAAGRELEHSFAPAVHEGILDLTNSINILSSAFHSFQDGFASRFRSLSAIEKAAFLTVLGLTMGKGGLGVFRAELPSSITSTPGSGPFIGPPGPVGYGDKEPGKELTYFAGALIEATKAVRIFTDVMPPVSGPIGPEAPANYGNAGYDPDAAAKARKALYGFAGIPTPEEMKATLDEVEQAAHEFQALFDSGQRDNMMLAEKGFAGLISTLESLGFSEDEARAKMESFGITLSRVSTAIIPSFSEQMAQLVHSFSLANFEMAAFQSAAEAMGTALADSLAGVGQGKQGMADLMLSISRMAFVFALMNVAFAVMSSTGVGAIVAMGTPTQFGKAAALFGAVGIAAGVAARAMGAGGADSGTASTGGAAAAAGASAGGGGRTEHWEVNFNGPTFGFNQAAFVRWIEDIRRRSAGSNP